MNIDDAKALTFKDLSKLEMGTALVDAYEHNIRYRVMRAGASLTVYVGVPIDHPLAGLDYNEIPISVHGGLTFGKEGEGEFHPEGWYWYGWDYAHLGDRTFYELEYSDMFQGHNDKEWTVEDVINDSYWDGFYQFSQLKKLIETVTSR
jgi:hypothetical protein